MSDFKDFKFQKGYDWELTYNGSDKDVVIPEELIAQAGEDAEIRFLSDCEQIESISIPKNVKSIWLGMFYRNESLKKITVDEQNKYLTSKDGVLFSKDMTKLIKAPVMMTGEYTVPESVITICMHAFSKSKLSKIILPDNLAEIEDYAFERCENLISISIPEGVEEIEESTFQLASNVKEFEFKGNTKITSIYGDNAEHLEELLIRKYFDHYSEGFLLQEVKTFPKLDENRQRFMAACKLGKFPKILDYLISTKPQTKVRKGIFKINDLTDTEVEIKKYIGKDENIQIPSEINGKKVVSIGEKAFNDNYYCINVQIPDGVTEIKDNAFKNCVSLKKVTIPESCKTLGKSIFEECKLLTYVNIPDGVTEIPEKAFYNCISIKKLDLPQTVERIKAEALKNCSSLVDFELPSNIYALDKEALYDCGFNHGEVPEGEWGYSLREFTMPESLKKISSAGETMFARYAAAQDKFGVFEYKIKLRVVKGSTAHKYAVKNHIRFVFVE